MLVLRGAQDRAALSAENLVFLEKLDAKVVHLAPDDTAAGGFVGLDGKYAAYMDAHEIRAMLVRPDFYLYGGAAGAAEIPDLVDSLAADLKRYGILATAEAA